ncbi:hypothetical protein BT69DRAFT_417739 [Atractiella rhizophila]|nr:hypothetical protein BT69DRAFT_417739 [Atractiella rhizophila]
MRENNGSVPQVETKEQARRSRQKRFQRATERSMNRVSSKEMSKTARTRRSYARTNNTSETKLRRHQTQTPFRFHLQGESAHLVIFPLQPGMIAAHNITSI